MLFCLNEDSHAINLARGKFVFISDSVSEQDKNSATVCIENVANKNLEHAVFRWNIHFPYFVICVFYVSISSTAPFLYCVISLFDAFVRTF